MTCSMWKNHCFDFEVYADNQPQTKYLKNEYVLFMGNQPPAKLPKGTIHQYKKSFREKVKDKKRLARGNCKQILKEKPLTEKEISDLTLKRLHTLGNQRFGSFPFSEHFDRWLANVTLVLGEFKSNPNIGVDDQFEKGCSETLAGIKRQLEEIRVKEASVNQEIEKLTDSKNRLEQINMQYLTEMQAIKAQKNREVKRLYSSLENLKKEEERVIRLKTGFFKGISKKQREQKEFEITQEISGKQREVELAILNLKATLKTLREEYERGKEPFLEQQNQIRKKIEKLETDDSLEERWFACEALIDAVNTFLQRKAIKPPSGSN